MRKKNFLSMLCFILSIAAGMVPAQQARAQEIGSLSYYDVPQSEYYDASTGQYKPEYYQWKTFLEYNLHREQCAHYQDPPAGYVVKGCQIYRVEQPVAAAAAASVQPAAGPAPAPAPEKSSAPATIYFNFDKSNIRYSEKEMLSSIVNEINADKPEHIIVAGHTDTAGPADYNIKLSQRRAKSVADALVASGIQKDIIEQKAYGKTDLAVPTADNVPLQANRRTVVILVQ